ncbi:MAG TPA: zf-HC2 domain-containing protein [Thermoanaerobaculia bacterium]|nr:zf-HC2 domain-containing protein [Thermoanaerobaculia bacterium]
MNTPDHDTYREWLHLEADGELSPAQHTRLEAHLATCADCRRQLQEYRALDGLIARGSLPVREDFKSGVMASLPVVGWEARHPRTWRFPAAVFALFAGLAAALVSFGSEGPAPSGLSALFAVAGLLRAAVQAGAGLLAASWKGLGMAFGDVMSSPLSLGTAAFLVLCLNLLLISLIRRRKPAASEAAVPANRKGGNGKNAG